ncbi:MAG TPA: DUF3375 domain-containing protein [Nitrospirae bacterium]|nr:DUF3375 domain-containing protein [Nitrospirota bacterium]
MNTSANTKSDMDYEYIVKLRKHPTWRLLNADSAPLIIAFFYKCFIKPNVRALAQGELENKLEDYLFHLRNIYGARLFPRSSREYLDEWAKGEQGYLRKYYPPHGDEPEYDLTPASEKAIEWLNSLKQKQFIGAESRLLMVFRFLRDIVRSVETDPQQRIAQLNKEKAAIDKEIERLNNGIIDPYDATQIKERYFQVQENARGLLSDFRQIEENFRELDRHVRELITMSEQSKGKMLEEIFGEQDAINDSDQGKSFRAFWAFLMSPDHQQELQQLLDRVFGLPEIADIETDDFLPGIKYHLMDAGEKVKRTNAGLVEQLRKFLDDRAWLENKRIIMLIRDIKKRAIEIKNTLPDNRHFTYIDDLRPGIELPMARSLFAPPSRPVIDADPEAGSPDFDDSVLFEQHYVDEMQLKANIRRALDKQNPVSLAEVCRLSPVEKGLNELIIYLHLANLDDRAVVDGRETEIIPWHNSEGAAKQATLPKVIFNR